MKKFLLLIPGLLVFYFGFSQKAELKLSPILESSPKYVEIIDYLGEYYGKHWCTSMEVRYKNAINIYPDIGFTTFEPDFTKGTNIDLVKRVDTLDAIRTISLNQKPVMVIRNNNEANKTVDFNFAIINEKGEISKQIDGPRFPKIKSHGVPKFYSTFSPDSTYFASYFYSDTDNKKDLLNIYIQVFNQEFDEIWSGNVNLNNSQKMLEIYDVDLTNEAKIYILYKEYIGKKKEEEINGTPGYKAKIAIADRSLILSGAIINTFDLQSNFITSMQSQILPNGNLSTHFLTSKSEKLIGNGYTWISIDKISNEIKNSKTYLFQKTDLEKFKKCCNLFIFEKEVGVSNNFVFSDILFTSDGSAYLTFENSTMEKFEPHGYEVINSPLYVIHYLYYINGMMVLRISPSGESYSMHVIPTYQVSSGDGIEYLGGRAYIVNDKFVFFYNEQKDNDLSYDIEKMGKKRKKSKAEYRPVIATFDQNENLIFNNVSDDFETALPISVKKMYRISENKFAYIGFVPERYKETGNKLGMITVQ